MENGIDLRQHDRTEVTQSPEKVKGASENASQGGHKRNISGGILGGLSFLRKSTKDAGTPVAQKREELSQADDDEGGKRASSIASALRQSQGRKRKGSLRKGILGKNMMRERRNSQLNQRVPAKPSVVNTQMDAAPPNDQTAQRRFSYENATLSSSSDSVQAPIGRLSVSTSASSSFSRDPDHPTPVFTSPTGPYTSTTDDDEGSSFFRLPSTNTGASYNATHLQSQSPTMSLQRRRSHRADQHSSLTIVHTPADVALEDEWDYSETEWWGWVVLVATWIVFVVGMGSCLGVWSWAWDVGETPYAPPELEDDATLPITGYYPALMVCTAVMAWVWVVVAWVGMKYFRHSKVVGDD